MWTRATIGLAVIFFALLIPSTAGAYTILLDIDLDDDPATINEWCVPDTATIRIVLQPTQPGEVLDAVSFAIGSRCYEVVPGLEVLGADFDFLDWSIDVPGLEGGYWGEVSNACGAAGQDAIYIYCDLVAANGTYDLGAPVFLDTFRAAISGYPGVVPPVPVHAFVDVLEGPVISGTVWLGATDTGVAGPAEAPPLTLWLLPCTPNPFNPRTTLSFTLPAAGQVQVAIYDAKGQMVARLVDESLTAGVHTVDWDGRDAFGVSMPSGTYFCRLTTAWGVETRKLQLVR